MPILKRAGADCLKQLGFRALRNYFMHSCLVRKNPCLSVASLDFFDDILKAENSFSNETGRQATAPDRFSIGTSLYIVSILMDRREPSG